MYQAKILADSISNRDIRLTTFEITYPRFVHAELLTHRVFSRNSASSRAIPVDKMLDAITHDPVLPVWWGKNQSGMQAKEELTGHDLEMVKRFWLESRDQSLNMLRTMGMFNLHKQVANRITEPWMWITVIVTATDWENFFKLRCHPDAQPEIRKIAEMMQDLYLINEDNYDVNLDGEFGELVHGDNAPIRKLREKEWHLPLITDEDEDLDGLLWVEAADAYLPTKVLVSAGRCARVSYLTHDGRRDPEADTTLALRLAESKHWSPWEHVATPFTEDQWGLIRVLQDTVTLSDFPNRMDWFEVRSLFRGFDYSGNFRGWHQARKFFDNEDGVAYE